MNKRYFGTDGIRGEADKFPIVPGFLYELALAINNSKKGIKKVLIGKDTRESCQMIEKSLTSGFDSLDVDCHSLGIVSTPILSFYTKILRYDYGIMISASHNPFKDNGIKIFNSNGEKLSDDEELRIESHISKDTKKTINFISPKKLKLKLDKYKTLILKETNSLEKFKIVLDCANGSLYKFAPELFDSLGANVIKFACEPNGRNINEKCGALNSQFVSELTVNHKADIGISFDGDADRLIISDEKGEILDGDMILAIIGSYMLDKKVLGENKIVSTQMCNLAFREYMKNIGITLYLSKVGDRYVVEKMKETGAIIGGEQSGHIIFSENGFSGDGLMTAIIIINLAKEKKISISKLCSNTFKKNPQKLINLKTKIDPQIILSHKEIKLLETSCLQDSPKTNILIRKSGTENLLRLMVQAKEKKIMDEIINKFLKLIKKIENDG